MGLIDRIRAPAPSPERVAWLDAWTYAHRGLHGPGAVENSPTAFVRAMEAGLGIECDVRRASDGRAVIFHDADLKRVTGRYGPVIARGVGELTSIPLGDGRDTIPTLRDVLELVAGRVPLLLEIKTDRQRPVKPLCRAVRGDLEGYAGDVAVMSFDARVGAWFSRRAAGITRGLVVSQQGKRKLSGAYGRHAAVWKAKPHFLACDIRDLPGGFAAGQRRRGLPLLTWTVKTAEQREIASAHADAAICEGEALA